MLRMRKGKDQEGPSDDSKGEASKGELSWVEKIINASSSWEEQQMEEEIKRANSIARGVNAMNCNDVLSTAISTIRDRGKSYGDVRTSMAKAANIASAILDKNITPSDIAIIATAIKLSRLSYDTKHSDSWIDAVAYASIAAQLSMETGSPKANEHFMDNVENGIKEALGLNNAD